MSSKSYVNISKEKMEWDSKDKSVHGKEFENSKFSEFCSSKEIGHDFSSPITPQQNWVVGRKNKTLQESARVMLHTKNLPYYFWAKAMNTTCHIHNCVTIRSETKATQYELCKGRKPTVKYFYIFGIKWYILEFRERRRKMDPKSDDKKFLGYSINSRAYKVYNKCTKTMMKSINVFIDDTSENKQEDEDEGDVSSQHIDVPSDVPDKIWHWVWKHKLWRSSNQQGTIN